MPRRKSKKPPGPLKEISQPTNVLQANKVANLEAKGSVVEHEASSLTIEPTGLRPILDDEENCQPCSSSSIVDNLSNNAAALYDELDFFRQRWRRELQDSNLHPQSAPKVTIPIANTPGNSVIDEIKNLNLVDETNMGVEASSSSLKSHKIQKSESTDQLYSKAKKLFLKAVELEQDEMHHESIRYYKEAMHLYPDIEKQIFKEQCETSAKETAAMAELAAKQTGDTISGDNDDGCNKVKLYERILQSYNEDPQNGSYIHCRPYKPKQGTLHISDLPQELILQIFRYVIGEDLDLASLETIGLVCRGFYLLSKGSSLWRSICYATWGSETTRPYCKADHNNESQSVEQIDWMKMFVDRPRVNYDGVYISRTRYIRQGDVGFQDITYRPFHVIRYYRYLRFFPDKRVLILTTNEEPDKIIPIFRHALHAKQFSSELSIMEGTFEFLDSNQVHIVAEKDCRSTLPSILTTQSQRRQAQFHWSRQTPITQKFNLKFELKTMENKPYKNNVLKWLDYTIFARLETGQEITSFDMSPDTFPNLQFSRVKRFNLKLTNPLSSH